MNFTNSGVSLQQRRVASLRIGRGLPDFGMQRLDVRGVFRRRALPSPPWQSVQASFTAAEACIGSIPL